VPRLLTGLLLVLTGALLIAPAPAFAKERPANETVVTKHFTKSIVLSETPPCVGTVTYDVHSTFHITQMGDGIVHVTDNQTGDVTFQSDADGQLYAGRFNGTFNLQSNRVGAAYSESSTYHLRVEAPDGAWLRFWITFHGTFTPYSDEPVVEVVNVRCAVAREVQVALPGQIARQHAQRLQAQPDA